MENIQMNAKVSVTLLALGFAGSALAQAPAFEEVDQNSDGMISQEEAAAVEGLDFATADTNQDGSLDRSEYESASSQE
jgi:Ca2+-binding EF-hand superfamily protein